MRQFYAGKGAPWCARELGRSVHAIRHRAQRLGLKQPSTILLEQRRASLPANFDSVLALKLARVKRGVYSVEDIARELGHPAWWLRRYAKLRGITAEKPSRAWAKQEESLLEDLSHLSLKQIRQGLLESGYDRTLDAISVRMHRLNIRREDLRLTSRRLAQVMGVVQETVSSWVRERGLKARVEDGKLIFEESDVWTWMRRNRQFVDLRRVNHGWFLDIAFAQTQKRARSKGD